MTVTSTDPRHWNVGLVGYGEVGRILAEDLRKQDVKVAVWERSDEVIQILLCGPMDCFAEPVIGRAFARPGGSQ